MPIDTYRSLQTKEVIDPARDLDQLFSLETEQIIANSKIKDHISKQDLRWLETEGYSITKFSNTNPLGTYAIDDFSDSRGIHSSKQHNLRKQDGILYRIQKHFHDNFSVISQAPTILTQEQIDSHPFKNTPTHAQAISQHSPKTNNCWSQPVLVGSGQFMTNNLNTATNYAQSGFEGAVVSVNKDGKIFGFRPDQNAKRIQQTCQGLQIPEIPEETYITAVRHVVLANSSYLPTPGSDSKLYIRPFVMGIDGGSGVAPASSYLFAIVVFPFANYFSSKEHTLDLVSIENTRRSTLGGVGQLKYSGNYARTMKHKQLAKQGLVPGFQGQKFDDVFYMGDNIIEAHSNGLKLTQEVLEEDAAGNLIFYKNTDNKVTFYSPALSRNTILPGITRSSILEICRLNGDQVIETHMRFPDLNQMTGAMLVGSAAGAVRINSMSFKNRTISFSSQEADIQPFNQIYNTLYALRKGDSSSFAANPESDTHNWPFFIGEI